MQRITVGVDGSAASRAALAWAVDQATCSETEVRVVHVWDRPYIGGNAFARMLADSDELEIQAQRELDGVIESVDTAGLASPVQRTLRCGRPADWLLREAKDADLLVIGQKGLGGIQLGSVGHRVTLHTSCPVVVVPAP
jgi:nucleotide-binding universal stress UspA family protein